MRPIVLFVIGIVFGTGLGFIIAVPSQGHDHSGHPDSNHDHSALTEWTGSPPSLALFITEDTGGAKNLFIDVNNFIFTPETVNTLPAAGTGHAHVYIDGIKKIRAYSPWVHLSKAPKGSSVQVTLNANDHSGWSLDGQPIVATITLP